MTTAVIIEGARTAFGKLGGSLSSFSAAQLGGIAIKEAIRRSTVEPQLIQQVIFGNVLQAGQGQIPSRQAAIEAGLSWEVASETVNKVCASGLRSITLADQIIRSGDNDIIVAGGMESMSNAPYAVLEARQGAKMGNKQFVDLMIRDGLSCSFTGVHMGIYGDATAEELTITREAQDYWALRSHQLAVQAIESGAIGEEIVSVAVPQRKGEPVILHQDEGPRQNTSFEALSTLKPAFQQDGTITAGNAPGINDGACAVVVMSEERAIREGIRPMATILAHTEIGIEAKNFPQSPGLAIQKLLEKTGKTVEEIDLYEINEAFAAATLASIQIAKINREKVNVHGGAVAFGHPIGASGARIVLTLAYELRRRGGGLGIAAICSGSGQGDAILIEVH